jgi:curved DNA-binding protein
MGQPAARQGPVDRHGQDQHATIQTTLEDATWAPPRWSCGCRFNTPTAAPAFKPARSICDPQGIRAGRHIRLAGQGLPGTGRGHAGTCTSMWSRAALLYSGPASPSMSSGLPITPWEAALGAESTPPTGRVEVKVPAGSAAGRLRHQAWLARHRLGKLPGDFTSRCASTPYAGGRRAGVAWPTRMASAFAAFAPRTGSSTTNAASPTRSASHEAPMTAPRRP